MSKSYNFIFKYFFILLSGFSAYSLQLNLLNKQSKVSNDQFFIQQEKQLIAKSTLQKKMPSFGLNNLIADWNFLQYIQYLGDTEAREVTGYSAITNYFETIVNKDPKFVDAHLSMSTSNSIFAGKPTKTVELLEKSLESITPSSSTYPFFLWSYKATDEVLFLGDFEAAKKSYRTAAEWSKLSNVEGKETIANRFLDTVAFLDTDPDSASAQISAWTLVLSSSSDQNVRKHALQKIEKLGGIITRKPNGTFEIKPPKKV